MGVGSWAEQESERAGPSSQVRAQGQGCGLCPDPLQSEGAVATLYLQKPLGLWYHVPEGTHPGVTLEAP